MTSVWLTVILAAYLTYLLLVLGGIILDYFHYSPRSLRAWSLRYLMGMVVWVTIIALLYYLNLLWAPYILVVMFYITLVTVRSGYQLMHRLWTDIKQYLKAVRRMSHLWQSCFAVVTGFVVIQLIACFAVPTNVAVVLPLRDLQLGIMKPSIISLIAVFGERLVDPSLANVLLGSMILALLGILGVSVYKLFMPGIAGIIALGFLLSIWMPAVFKPLNSSSALLNVTGFKQQDDYLRGQLDCNYEIAQYVAQANLGGNYIDNWSFGYDERYQYFVPAVHFFPLPADIPTSQIASALRTMAASYILVSETARSYYSASTILATQTYFRQRVFQEEIILEAATPVYTAEHCTLYRIDVDQLEP